MRSSPVNGEVEPHQFCELLFAVAQHVGEVMRPVQVGVDGTDAAALAVQVAVDLSRHAGELGDQVHGILIHELHRKINVCHANIYYEILNSLSLKSGRARWG